MVSHPSEYPYSSAEGAGDAPQGAPAKTLRDVLLAAYDQHVKPQQQQRRTVSFVDPNSPRFPDAGFAPGHPPLQIAQAPLSTPTPWTAALASGIEDQNKRQQQYERRPFDLQRFFRTFSQPDIQDAGITGPGDIG